MDRLHALLRRLLPTDFRSAFGDEMGIAFRDAWDAARRRGWSAAISLLFREVWDVAATGRALRQDARRGAGSLATRDARRWGGGMMGWMDDVRYAVRSLVRRPGFAAFAIITLALGIGAATAIFSTVESVLLNPVPYEHGDRLIAVYQRIGAGGAYVPPGRELRERAAAQTDLLESLEPWTSRSMTLSGIGESREVWSVLVRPDFHDMIGRHPLLGRTFEPAELAGEGAPVVLLGHEMWQSAFGGSPEVLGQSVTLDGEPWTIIGIMPPRTPMPAFGLRRVDLWRPLSGDFQGDGAVGLGLLRADVTLEQLNERLASLPAEDSRWVATALLIRDEIGRSVREPLQLLMVAVTLLLLISCVNVSNLLLFRADTRRRETAVRIALGSGRRRLIRQQLMESLVLSLLGGAAGLGFALWAQKAILRLRPSRLEVLDHVALSPEVTLFALGVTLLTGLLFGVAPALTAGGRSELTPLRSGVRTEGDLAGRTLRWVLIAGEVALSFALLLGSLTVLDTMLDKQRIDVGYRADEIVTMEVQLPPWRYDSPEARFAVFDQLGTRLTSVPGVERVARSSGVPPRTGISFGVVQVEGGEPGEDTHVLHGPATDTAYLATLGQSLVRGRWFSALEMSGDEETAVIGEATAREFFGTDDPVGKRMRIGNDSEWVRVIGVARDIAIMGPGSGSGQLQMYHPLREDYPFTTYSLRIPDRSQAEAAVPVMRDLTREVDPDIRIDLIAHGEDLVRETLDRERFTTAIMGTFAILALLLSAVGLYGVVSQVVGQRTREIGIRVALGARRSNVVALVLKRAGGATAVGIVVGVALTIGGRGLLDSQVVGAEGTGLATYLLAAAGLTATTLLAAYGPARHATRVDPVEAMRVE